MLNLDRAASSLTADISDPLSAIASSQENIAQTRQQIHQLTNDRRTQIASDLAAVQSKILDLGPSLANAEDALGRSEIRSPHDGKVVGLQVHSTGALIAPGATIPDIVPDMKAL